jgi:ABC-2 type transport system permease protein
VTRLRSLRLKLAVAAWEFRRFYKLRDQLLSLVLAMVGGAFGFGVQHFVAKATGPVRVAVLHADRLPGVVLPKESRIELRPHDESEEQKLRDAVGVKELDGLLVIRSLDKVDLLVLKDPVWLNELHAALSEARAKAKLQAADVSPQLLKEARQAMPLSLVYHEAGAQAASRAEKVAAGIFIALTCLGVFLGMASFFTGITGEKQLRVTEQVVAAISPQTWVDGKLLGLTAAAFGTLLTYGGALALFFCLLKLSGMDFPIPWTAIRPDKLMYFLVLAVLGIFFWNCVFAAIAVTINDPNSSTRSSLMFLPMMFVGMGFPGLAKPDAPVMRALAVMPGTSPTVMTARLVLSDVAGWEAVTAVLLLVLAILVLRRIAGKVFAAGILMTGKELSWAEAWRALRRA